MPTDPPLDTCRHKNYSLFTRPLDKTTNVKSTQGLPVLPNSPQASEGYHTELASKALRNTPRQQRVKEPRGKTATLFTQPHVFTGTLEFCRANEKEVLQLSVQVQSCQAMPCPELRLHKQFPQQTQHSLVRSESCEVESSFLLSCLKQRVTYRSAAEACKK